MVFFGACFPINIGAILSLFTDGAGEPNCNKAGRQAMVQGGVELVRACPNKGDEHWFD